MNWTVVIKNGPHLNATLAGILYDKWGAKTNQEVIVCDDWQYGHQSALNQGYQYALFVDSGTCFIDWPEWKKLLESYPHQGLIAHIIWHPGTHPRLHEQCWFMDIKNLQLQNVDFLEYPTPVRSDQNLHDGYTPLWIKSSDNVVAHQADGFGQSLISQQMHQKRMIANWNNASRNLKKFLYPDTDVKKIYSHYLEMAENQLWVLNNESIDQTKDTSLVSPGSGLFWVINIVYPQTEKMHIVDISKIQIKFCQCLWDQWDGQNYGQFAWQFISQNQLQHYELDCNDLSPLERLKFRNAKYFIPHVQEKFKDALVKIGHDEESFAASWQQSRINKQVTFQHGNLVDWALDNPDLKGFQSVWTSNILDYKWTMINNKRDHIEQFRTIVNEAKNQ